VNVLHPGREKSARARRRVVKGSNDALFGERFVVFHKHQRGGEAHDIARREVFPGGFVGAFGKTTDQLLKDQPHIMVGDGLRAEIGGGKLLHHFVEEIGIIQQPNEFAEFKVLENLPRVSGKILNVVFQVGLMSFCPILLRSSGEALKNVSPLVARRINFSFASSGRGEERTF
jgi:hypothetical protein